MSKLVLLRHGQSIWNLENKFTGWMDIYLSDQGIGKAHQAGKLLKGNGTPLMWHLHRPSPGATAGHKYENVFGSLVSSLELYVSFNVTTQVYVRQDNRINLIF